MKGPDHLAQGHRGRADISTMPRVLVVDDDPDLVRIVTFRLQSKGHRVIGASTAEDALTAVSERGRPDIVVLDVTMPGMNGLDLLGRLRALDGMQDLPAIFLSAKVS